MKDIGRLPAQRFIDWTFRLPAYQGVLAATMAEEAETGGGSAPAGPRRVESSATVLMTDPVLASVGEFAQAERPVDG